MTLHAKMCCYSTDTTPLSILDDLGFVLFATGPATGRSEKPGRLCVPLQKQMGRLRVLTVCDHFTFRENPLHFRLAPFCPFCIPGGVKVACPLCLHNRTDYSKQGNFRFHEPPYLQ